MKASTAKADFTAELEATCNKLEHQINATPGVKATIAPAFQKAILEAHRASVRREKVEGQLNGAAFAIKIIDELHIGTEHSTTTDRLFKGLKNTIRDRYKAEVGVDPAPNYPIKVELIGEQE